MFDTLSKLTKAAVGVVVEVPVSLVADTITMAGALTDRERPYTFDAARRIVKNVKEAAE